MKKILHYTKLFLVIPVIISLIYSVYSHTKNSNPENIPLLKDKSQLSSEFVRVKITKAEPIPISLESTLSRKRLGITTSTSKTSTVFLYITSDSNISFITPLTNETIKKEKIEVGSTAIFGMSSTDFPQVEKKKADLLEIVKTDYPQFVTQNVLYFQGKNADVFQSYTTFLGTSVSMVVILAIIVKIEGFTKSKSLKE
jgi:hypothetical protein